MIDDLFDGSLDGFLESGWENSCQRFPEEDYITFVNMVAYGSMNRKEVIDESVVFLSGKGYGDEMGTIYDCFIEHFETCEACKEAYELMVSDLEEVREEEEHYRRKLFGDAEEDEEGDN
jgi:hypothetical protein